MLVFFLCSNHFLDIYILLFLWFMLTCPVRVMEWYIRSRGMFTKNAFYRNHKDLVLFVISYHLKIE